MEIHVVWLKINAYPSELKLSEIWVRSRNHYKINDWQLFVIDWYEASIYDIKCLEKFITGISGCLV